MTFTIILAEVIGAVVVILLFALLGNHIDEMDINPSPLQFHASTICAIFGIFGVLYCYHRLNVNSIAYLENEIKDLKSQILGNGKQS